MQAEAAVRLVLPDIAWAERMQRGMRIHLTSSRICTHQTMCDGRIERRLGDRVRSILN